MPRRRQPDEAPEPMPETVEDAQEAERSSASPAGGNGAEDPAPKRRYRKRAKRADLPPDIEAIMASTTRGLVALTFAIVAKARGPHWSLSDQETSALGGACDYWVKVRAPFLLAWAPEIMLIGVTAGIVIPRLVEGRFRASKPAEAEVIQ